MLLDHALVACRHLLIPAYMEGSHLENLDALEAQIERLEESRDMTVRRLGIVPVGYRATPCERTFLEGLKTEFPGAVGPSLRWRDTAKEDAYTHGHSVLSHKPAKAHRRRALRECQEDYFRLAEFIQERVKKESS